MWCLIISGLLSFTRLSYRALDCSRNNQLRLPFPCFSPCTEPLGGPEKRNLTWGPALRFLWRHCLLIDVSEDFVTSTHPFAYFSLITMLSLHSCLKKRVHASSSYLSFAVSITFFFPLLRWDWKGQFAFCSLGTSGRTVFQQGWHHLFIFLPPDLNRRNVIYLHDKSDLAGAWKINGFGIRIKRTF